MTSLGFIGTGSLASFFVEGLARAGAGEVIMVSPRNAEKAESLRQRFGVTIAGNQHIADTCDLVVVSVLPRQAEAVLRPLRFRSGQTVLSVMSDIRLARVRELVSPAYAAVSMMPGSSNAYNVGPSVLHPENAAARALLERLGPVHAYDTEDTFLAASVMGAFSGMATLLLGEVHAYQEKLDPRALKARCTITAPPTDSSDRMLATSPVTWPAGTDSTVRSPVRSAMPV